MICPPLNRKRSDRAHHDRNDRRNCYCRLRHSEIVDLFLANTIKIGRRAAEILERGRGPGAPSPAFGTWETTNPTPAAGSLPSPGRENAKIAQGEVRRGGRNPGSASHHPTRRPVGPARNLPTTSLISDP